MLVAAGLASFLTGGVIRIVYELGRTGTRGDPTAVRPIPEPMPNPSVPVRPPAPPPIVMSVRPQHVSMEPLLLGMKGEFIREKQDFIEADLRDMKLRAYRAGELQKEYNVLVKGREGDWGETAAGLFKIRNKELAHFSSLGRVYMPFNMTFQGNYSIHGWPYYPDGTPTVRSFSSGCINLSTEDAGELFAFASSDMPVLVVAPGFENDDFSYVPPAAVTPEPALGAQAYLAVDLKSGFVFLSKNPRLRLPIASITKLMTALVSSEYNLLSFTKAMTTHIKITDEMTAPIGELAGLVPGKEFTYFDLLYPLLISSSNDAAEALASRGGKTRFLARMNERASSLGMQDTVYIDTYGYDPGNISTVSDLYYLAKYLLNNRRWLLEITRGKVYHDFGPIAFAGLTNQNLFADDPAFLGGKTGATPMALRSGTFLFNLKTNRGERPIAIIVLKSPDNRRDVELLLDWVKKNFGDETAIGLEGGARPE